jgi:nucleotide-binding universal stress UspA family protein
VSQAADPTPLKHILLAVDQAEDIEDTIGLVAGLAKAFGSEVSVYHARERVVKASSTAEKESIHDSFEFGSGIADRLMERGVKATALVESARPDRLADHLLAQAEATGAELIVIGGHHPHNVRERVLGDIGRQLAHRALCPVLMMPSATRTHPPSAG